MKMKICFYGFENVSLLRLTGSSNKHEIRVFCNLSKESSADAVEDFYGRQTIT